MYRLLIVVLDLMHIYAFIQLSLCICGFWWKWVCSVDTSDQPALTIRLQARVLV